MGRNLACRRISGFVLWIYDYSKIENLINKHETLYYQEYLVLGAFHLESLADILIQSKVLYQFAQSIEPIFVIVEPISYLDRVLKNFDGISHQITAPR